MELTGKNNAEIIAQLCDRYGIGKSSVYNRLKFLDIATGRKDGQTYLLSSEVELLDELQNWIRDGNSQESFPKKGALVKSGAGELGSENAEAIFVEDVDGEDSHIRRLLRKGQEMAAGLLIAENLLAAQYRDNPDQLDDDLKAKLKDAEEALAPKSLDPTEYALSLVEKCQRQQANCSKTEFREIA